MVHIQIMSDGARLNNHNVYLKWEYDLTVKLYLKSNSHYPALVSIFRRNNKYTFIWYECYFLRRKKLFKRQNNVWEFDILMTL